MGGGVVAVGQKQWCWCLFFQGGRRNPRVELAGKMRPITHGVVPCVVTVDDETMREVDDS